LEEVRLTWKGIVVDGDLFLLLLIVVSIFFLSTKSVFFLCGCVEEEKSWE
jgi:hypothetical protein